jgi:hypothetical protein
VRDVRQIKDIRKPMKIWLIAFGIVLFQLGSALSFSKASNLIPAYRQLCQWDSEWYCDIVERGYAIYVPTPPPGHAKDNGGFFPGYPLSARVLHVSLGFDSRVALLCVAQSAAVVFWAVFLFLLKRWHVGLPYRALAVLAVLGHPCSFYLVVGYSESLFCAALVLMVYFSLKRSSHAQLGMATSGFAMSATRIMGLPMAALPALNSLFRKRPSWSRTLAIGLLSSLGTGLFFLYCKLHFGDFGHYMKTQKEGWGIVPDYLAVFKSNNYCWTGNDDQMSMSLTLVALLLTLYIELLVSVWAFRRSPESRKCELWRVRLPWYLGVFALWYLSSSGVAGVSFRSLIRYSLPWTLLLIIAWTHLFSFSIRLPKVGKIAVFSVLAILLALLFSHRTMELLNAYLHSKWVS